jgi:hypothetical protein
MSKKAGTIQQIVADGLCTGCGTCAGICSQSAIKIMHDRRKRPILT